MKDLRDRLGSMDEKQVERSTELMGCVDKALKAEALVLAGSVEEAHELTRAMLGGLIRAENALTRTELGAKHDRMAQGGELAPVTRAHTRCTLDSHCTLFLFSSVCAPYFDSLFFLLFLFFLPLFSLSLQARTSASLTQP
jgi:hypothetical protein